MSIIPGVNLPWPILAHAVGLTFLGLKLIFVPSGPPGRASNMLGIAILGLGLAYLSTSYMPMHENQFLYASAPVRMVLGGVAVLKLLVTGNRMSAEYFKELLIVALYDGIGGFLLGWWLGTWWGRIPGFERV